MHKSAHFLCAAPIFHGISLPEEGTVVGYAAIIHVLGWKIPMPGLIALVSARNRKYTTGRWVVYPQAYLPEDTAEITEMEALYRQLVFALKYEGVNLLVFKKISQHYTSNQLEALVQTEPSGQYSRRIWFLIEWLSGKPLSIPTNISKKSYIKLVDDTMQYAVEGIASPRHKVINNLPGTIDFCPLVFRSPKLEQYIQTGLAERQSMYWEGLGKDVLQRASAFLLLKDSKASFSIEGESPKSMRAARWSKAIGLAGTQVLSKEELLRLQHIIIENPRFVQMGYRTKGGFVGEHEPGTGEPIPDHISAKWQDVEMLMRGLIDTCKLLVNSDIDAVVGAAIIAFGFVFIHPFEDGNGRLHRYLIHHILAQKAFTRHGVIFPISAAILARIQDYRAVLESYSMPVLECIEWRETEDHNVEVLNDTIDLYRYFDATEQVEFLYDCVQATIKEIIPEEVEYLIRYDTFKKEMQEQYAMPDKMIALLFRFLEQHGGQLSNRAKEKEFQALDAQEIAAIEAAYERIGGGQKRG